MNRPLSNASLALVALIAVGQGAGLRPSRPRQW